MMDYSDFTRAADLVRQLQGAALFFLGASELWSPDGKGGRWRAAAAAALAVSGAAMMLAILALPGGWSFARLSEALSARPGFHIFISFAGVFTGAGLCLLTHEALGRREGAWRWAFLALLLFACALYFLTPGRLGDEVRREALLRNSAIGVTLLLAVAARAADLLRPRRALRLSWSLLLVFAGMQLVSYREKDAAFAPRLVTLQSPPEAPVR